MSIRPTVFISICLLSTRTYGTLGLVFFGLLKRLCLLHSERALDSGSVQIEWEGLGWKYETMGPVQLFTLSHGSQFHLCTFSFHSVFPDGWISSMTLASIMNKKYICISTISSSIRFCLIQIVFFFSSFNKGSNQRSFQNLLILKHLIRKVHMFSQIYLQLECR